MLAATHRLRRPADFRAVIRSGRRLGDRLTVVYVAPARGPQQLSDAVAKTAPTWQAGLVVSKAVGNSVVRHRVARRLRAVLAALLPRLGEPKMVVVRALPAAAKATYSELERSVGKCLRQAAC